MANSVDIVVNVITKLKDSGVKEAESRFGKVGGGLKKAMVPAIAATGAILAFGAAAVQSASRLEQAIGATDAVFGKNASAVKRWADSSANSVGLAKSEYLELSNVLGAQLKNMGIPMERVAGQTKDLVGLGADLSAQFGGTTAEAVQALSSLLRGETDPIERYGVSINQAAIAAQMAADGTDKLTGEQAKAAKTQATLALLTKQTASAQGAFARESDTAAHAQQVAAAQYENAKAALGEALLPALTKVMGALSKFAEFAQRHPAVIQALIAVVLALAAAVIVLNVAMLVLAANPVVLTIAAIVIAVIAVGAALVIAYKRSEKFRAVVNAVFAAIKAVVVAVARVIRTVFNAVFQALRAYVLAYRAVVLAVFNAVRGVAATVAGAVRTMWANTWGAIKTAARTVTGAVRSALDGVRNAAEAVASFVTRALTACWEGVKRAATSAFNAILSPINAVKSAINAVVSAVQSLIGWLGKIKVPKIKLPSLPGLGRSAPVPEVAGRTAMALTSTPRVSGRALTAAPLASANVTYITVTGALDPEAVARQVGRLLDGHARRVRGSALRGRAALS